MRVEEARGVVLGEVLPLEEHAGPAGLHRIDEVGDEPVVVVAGHAVMAPSQVQRIVPDQRVVGADVEQHGQRTARIDAADGRVERQFPDGDRHATEALVAEAEDPLTVGQDDHVDVCRRSRQGGGHPVSFRIRDEQAVWPPVDAAELLARVAHRRRVDHWQQIDQVVPEESVEEHLVAVLQRPEVDVALEVVVQP